MREKKQLCIGLSLSATWKKGNSGQQSDSGAKPFSNDSFVQLAKMAEKAKLDFVFKPDALFLHTEGQGHSSRFASLDPTIMLTSIARETERIGLVTTVSTSFNPPFVVARQLQSLHWLSDGRAGWNIVTSIGGAENFTNSPMPSSEERYAKAIEFTDVVRRLWESFPYEALTTDSASGQADAGKKISAIHHNGEYFSVKGPLNLPAHASGTPPLFQAGASDSGRNFAALVADAIFASTPDMASGIELRQDLRKRAKAHGRSPDAVRVLPGLYFFLADTRSEARDMYREAHAHLSMERRYASVQSILGLRLDGMPLDRRVTADMLPDPRQPVRSRTHADLLRRFIVNRQPTVEELLSRPEVVGSAHWVVAGTAEEVMREMITWFEAGAMDGVIALPGGSIHSLELFLDELVPMLVEQGLFRSEYTGTTLREHLRIT
ncbi:NtaA/DmoA family FMN-dependent monooxygenase [Paenibacillus hemerocallicola]|uniref:NtaA/DmoA family FMN-dependent monooxygenase n=1 Tax=Paenibacillus hemerocallicola TaxID=1172614 RepID=A0A5C4TC12_9BACL|nr:NtaA/DmoA family FMN-dependent monooxygenase [Paenibacillus hemerocallicola]TNJ65999.1 NtaA/DmoA family FMN-dependent monooxygenase [Paenibacillus hemerocallicola]